MFGGGPSAPRFYDVVRKLGYSVIAPSTMLLPLQRAGVKVDVCCILDGSVVMPLHFRGADQTGELVHVASIRREISDGWRGKKTQIDGRQCGGSSVLHMCVMEAIYRQAKTVHLVGADFCYSDGKSSHAAGVVTSYDINRHAPMEAENGKKETVRTERGLLHFRSQLGHIVVKHPGVRFVRYGREGLPIPGVEWATAEGVGVAGG